MQQTTLVQDKSSYSFRLGNFFPPQVHSCGVLGIAVAIYLFSQGMVLHPVWLLLISILIISGSKGASINFQKKWVKNYIRIGGISFGEKIPYQELEELVVVKTKVSQKMYSRVSSSTVRFEVYRAYALTDQKRFLLLEGRQKEKILSKVETLAGAAGIKITDLT